MKKVIGMMFRVRLALADLAFSLGLLALLPWLGLCVCGGTDARGGYVSDANSMSTSDFAAFLKETHGDLNSALRTAAYLHDRLSKEKPPFKIEGSKLVMSLITGHNMGAAFTTGGGALPVAGVRTGIRPETTFSRLVQCLAFDDTTLVMAGSAAGAFIKTAALADEMEALKETGKLLLNQACQRDKTCRLGTVSGVNSTVVTFDNAGLGWAVTGDRVKYFIENMYIDFAAADGTVHDAGIKVSSIDPANNQITCETAPTHTVPGDYAVLGILGGASNSADRGLTGLEAWLGSVTNTVWGINRSLAVNAKYRPVRVNANNSAVTQKLIRRLIGTVQQYGADRGLRLADNKIEGAVLYTSIPDKDAYGDVLLTQKRIVNDMTLQGGWLAVECEGYPMVSDPDAPVGKIRFLNMGDWSFGSPDGTIAPTLWSPDGLVLRQVPGYDRWMAMLASRLEIGCVNPNRSGELYGLNTAAYGLEAS